MQISSLITSNGKPVQAQNILRDKGAVTLIRIDQDAVLRDHESVSEALLILLSGRARYETAAGDSTLLQQPQDFVRIPSKLTHRVIGLENSLLMLIQ